MAKDAGRKTTTRPDVGMHWGLTVGQEAALVESLVRFSARWGWDAASIVLGYAMGVGKTEDEALELANRTRYDLVGVKPK